MSTNVFYKTVCVIFINVFVQKCLANIVFLLQLILSHLFSISDVVIRSIISKHVKIFYLFVDNYCSLSLLNLFQHYFSVNNKISIKVRVCSNN